MTPVAENRPSKGCLIVLVVLVGAVIGGGLALSSGFILLVYAEVMGKSGYHQAPLLGFFLLPYGVLGGAIIAPLTWATIVMFQRKAEK